MTKQLNPEVQELVNQGRFQEANELRRQQENSQKTRLTDEAAAQPDKPLTTFGKSVGAGVLDYPISLFDVFGIPLEGLSRVQKGLEQDVNESNNPIAASLGEKLGNWGPALAGGYALRGAKYIKPVIDTVKSTSKGIGDYFKDFKEKQRLGNEIKKETLEQLRNDKNIKNLLTEQKLRQEDLNLELTKGKINLTEKQIEKITDGIIRGKTFDVVKTEGMELRNLFTKQQIEKLEQQYNFNATNMQIKNLIGRGKLSDMKQKFDIIEKTKGIEEARDYINYEILLETLNAMKNPPSSFVNTIKNSTKKGNQIITKAQSVRGKVNAKK